MAKANPENLPYAQYEEFRHTPNDGSKIEIKPQQFFGSLETIRAHVFPEELSVIYLAIENIELIAEKLKAGLRFAVTFQARFEIRNQEGKRMPVAGRSDNNRTRVAYYNFSETALHRLSFMRHDGDKLLFLAACNDAALLLKIAAAHTRENKQVAEAAYNRGSSLIKAGFADENIATAFAAYIAGLIATGKNAEANAAIGYFRNLDRSGEGGEILAQRLAAGGYPAALLQAILVEATERLLHSKPKQYSLKLYNILDFVLKHNLEKPVAGALLWQAYLAAASERAVRVLRHIWLRAVKMKADRETLRIIYQTWRGFSPPRRALASGQTLAPRPHLAEKPEPER